MGNNNGFKVKDISDNFDLMEIDSSYSNKRFKRKKHGFFQKCGAAISGSWSKLKRWQKVIIVSLTSLVALVVAVAIILSSGVGYNYNNITANPEELGFENIIDEKIVNIALFGVDTRSLKSLKGNSDSIMVLSINTETKTVKIVSIMRDSLVAIEKKGKTSYKKINSAYASGGPELAIKTINQNFGLDISEYATVNFYGMAEIIDAVGGIDAELTSQEVSTNHADGFNGLVERQCEKFGVDPQNYYIRTEGKHHLNGIQAVAYSRIRKFKNIWGTNNDFGRTDRQRYVMEQLFNKALKLPKSQYVKLVKALIPYTQTSLSYKEIMGLAFDVLLKSPTFEQSRMPLSEYQMKAPSIPSVGSCVYYDLEFAKNVLRAFFYEDITPEEYVKENGVTKNDWYANRNSNGSTQSSTGSKDTSTSSKESASKENSSQSSSNVSSEVVSSSKPQTSQPSSSQSESSSKVESVSSQTSSESETSSEETSSKEETVSDEPSGSSEVSSVESAPTTSDESSAVESVPSIEETPVSSEEDLTESKLESGAQEDADESATAEETATQ